MIFTIDGLDEVIRESRAAERVKKRATKSALGSVGFFLIKELKEQIKTAGSRSGTPWRKQHPLTRLPPQRSGRRQRLTLRRNKPLSSLKRFTRYRVSDNAVQVLFARNKRGRVGQIDRLMNQFVSRSESGLTQRLTERSKRFRAARGFPVRKSTNTIRIPKRPLISAVFNKNKSKIKNVFSDKFNASIARQTE